MTSLEQAKVCFGLAKDLNGPFSCDIDLVEQSAVRNPILRRLVEETCGDAHAVA